MRLSVVVAATMVAATLVPVPAASAAESAPASAGDAQPATYSNPVSAGFADTFADPSVLRGEDGRWYAYATADPLRSGHQQRVNMPIASSTDLTNWSSAGSVFTDANRPTWVTDDSSFFAPDIRHLDGHYQLYYAATDTTLNAGSDSAIGVATAPTPTGPWTDSGAPLILPRPGGNNDFKATIDPDLLTTADGTRYLYYGSYFGGVWAQRLTDDGLRTVGDPTMVAIDNRYEGAYVIQHDGWYYLFASADNCCAGPTSGYVVFTGRSRSPLGPFIDANGVSMSTSRVGGTIVVAPNGNRWVGTGHNAVVTDLSGQTWLMYHAIDRNQPYLDDPFGINRRPMMLDRLDWINGWPTVRAGAWASDTPQPSPVTTGPVYDTFAAGLGAGWTPADGDWSAQGSGDTGFVSTVEGTLLATASVPRDLRVEADVRLPDADTAGVGTAGARTAGVVARWQDADNHVAVQVDTEHQALVATVVQDGTATRTSASLPASFHPGQWHNVAVEIRGGALSASVSDDRLGDPYATLTTTVPVALSSGAVGLTGHGGQSDMDNASAARLYTPVTRSVGTPSVGTLLPAFSDDFAGGLGSGWSWVRQDAAATVADGALQWPTEAADLVGTGNNAGLLLRQPPSGDYVMETQVHLDLGVDDVRNFEQAGMIVYNNDDDFLRLCSVAIWNTRQTEYGKEIPQAGATNFGATLGGPPGVTTWLRLAHHVNAAGEHVFRMASSPDGVHWTWGGSYTLPAGATPRIGLVSMGGNQPPATASFEYFHVYRS